MTSIDVPSAPRTGFAALPRWARIALPVSIALNLLIVGMVGGGLWRLRQHATLSSIGPSMLDYSQSLPTEKRDGVRRHFADQRATIRPLRRAAQEARQELRRAMLAEPYDKARVIAAHEAVVTAETRVRSAIGGIVAVAAEQLTVDERRKFLNWRGGSRRGFGAGGDGMIGAEPGEPDEGGRKRRP